jgi:hypothetical protein
LTLQVKQERFGLHRKILSRVSFLPKPSHNKPLCLTSPISSERFLVLIRENTSFSSFFYLIPMTNSLQGENTITNEKSEINAENKDKPTK